MVDEKIKKVKGTGEVVKPKVKTSDALQALLDADPEAQTLNPASGLSIKIKGVISTQVPSLDDAIGRGGVPLGRLTILHGGEGSGKTTLALHTVAEVQRMGGVAIYMDLEYKLDIDYAQAIGVDPSSLVYKQPDHLEGAFDAMGKYIEVIQRRAEAGDKTPYLIVLDSMNAAISKSEFEGDWEDQHMAPQARVYSRLLPKLIPKASKANVALLWISQVRQKMNVQFGDDQEIAGGKSARFYASLIIDVKNIGKAKEGSDDKKEVVGSRVIVTCKKNQIAMPFRSAELEISYGRGVNKQLSLLSIGEKYGVVSKSGSWMEFAGKRFANGYPQACRKLLEDSTLEDSIKAAIKERKESGLKS